MSSDYEIETSDLELFCAILIVIFFFGGGFFFLAVVFDAEGAVLDGADLVVGFFFIPLETIYNSQVMIIILNRNR